MSADFLVWWINWENFHLISQRRPSHSESSSRRTMHGFGARHNERPLKKSRKLWPQLRFWHCLTRHVRQLSQLMLRATYVVQYWYRSSLKGSWNHISRSLTPTEQRYAQIEKEAFAFTWAMVIGILIIWYLDYPNVKFSQTTPIFMKATWVIAIATSCKMAPSNHQRTEKEYWLLKRRQAHTYRYILYRVLLRKWTIHYSCTNLKSSPKKIVDMDMKKKTIEDWWMAIARWSTVFLVWTTAWESHVCYRASVEVGICSRLAPYIAVD